MRAAATKSCKEHRRCWEGKGLANAHGTRPIELVVIFVCVSQRISHTFLDFNLVTIKMTISFKRALKLSVCNCRLLQETHHYCE
eukprot:4469244-Amphidinium_carterae.1